jgi:hypothetical protein
MRPLTLMERDKYIERFLPVHIFIKSLQVDLQIFSDLSLFQFHALLEPRCILPPRVIAQCIVKQNLSLLPQKPSKRPVDRVWTSYFCDI